MSTTCLVYNSTVLLISVFVIAALISQICENLYHPETSWLCCEDYLKNVMLACWQSPPKLRPDFPTLGSQLKPFRAIMLVHSKMDKEGQLQCINTMILTTIGITWIGHCLLYWDHSEHPSQNSLKLALTAQTSRIYLCYRVISCRIQHMPLPL